MKKFDIAEFGFYSGLLTVEIKYIYIDKKE